MKFIYDQIVAMVATPRLGKVMANLFIEQFFDKVDNENIYILLNQRGYVGSILQFVILNPTITMKELFDNPTLDYLDPVKISSNSIILNKLIVCKKINMHVTITLADPSITSIDDISDRWGNIIMYGKQGFVYGYKIIKKRNQAIHAELIAELFKPWRIKLWLDTGNELDHYLL